MLNCRRCNSVRLLELVRLGGGDHMVYRCRECGFLFSPPERELGEAGAGGVDITPALPPESAEAARRRLQDVAAVRRRPASLR